MAFPARARSAGVTAASGDGQCRGRARAAARRAPQVLRRSCQSDGGESPAGASRPSPQRAPGRYLAPCTQLVPDHAPDGARRAPRALDDARHTAATLLLAQGAGQRVVMEILGHSQISMTSKYAHVLPQVMTDAADRIGQALWGSAAKPTATRSATRKPSRSSG
jgi:integrase